MRLAGEIMDLKDVETFNAYSMTMHPCTDCKRCMKTPGCIFDTDDATRFIETLKDKDTLIIVSPIHFGSFSSEVVTLLSRLQTLYNGKFTRKDDIKKLTNLKVITTAGANKASMFDGAELTYSILKSLFEPDTFEFITLKNSDALMDSSSLKPHASIKN